MRPKFIIIHHTLVSRSKNSEQFDAIRRNHINKGWGDIGYHFLLEPSGSIKIGRLANKVGAHCKELFMNYRSIGICLTGDFDHENPTIEQMLQLKNLVAKLRKEHKIPAKNVRAHRYYAKYKSCPGNNFTTRMIQDVAENINSDQMASLWAFDDWKKMMDNKIITKNPHANITKQEMAVIIGRLKKKKYFNS